MFLPRCEKIIITLSLVAGLMLFTPAPTFAMHITEGFLPPAWSFAWGALALPCVAAGFFSIRKKVAGSSKALLLLALCGAFAFMLSALKIPSATGSCSHPTGVGLGAILFGPLAMSVIGLIVLLFQAMLLGHGGLTTLGANTFSMGVAGPLAAFAVYKLAKKLGCPLAAAVFLAAFLGDIITYIVTAIQLALAYPDNGSILTALAKFLGVFALTQLPLAVCEGIVTVVVFNVLEKYSNKELQELSVI